MCCSSFSPDEGLLVFHDLVQARRRLILDCPLHLLYLLTPVAHNLKPDFGVLWTVYQRAQRHDPSKVCFHRGDSVVLGCPVMPVRPLKPL